MIKKLKSPPESSKKHNELSEPSDSFSLGVSQSRFFFIEIDQNYITALRIEI